VDARIINLDSTTFCGRRFTRRQLADVQQTVASFPALSRKELARTICEHLNWHTPKGDYRVAAGLRLLEELERLGILQLPAKRTQAMRPGPRKAPALTARSAPQAPIEGSLRQLQPLGLELLEASADSALWNEFVERFHYLGYRQPLGPHLRYFLRDCHGRLLGCLLFSQATRALPCRDQWVGWQPGQYKQHLDLVVSQPRFLLLPWVRVQHLASHALALAVRQLPQHWQQRFSRRPVLLETFVDPARYRGTCYRAANWLHLGRTQARAEAGHSPKDVYVYPLSKHCRSILLHGPRPRTRQRPPAAAPPSSAAEDDFLALWQGLIATLTEIAAAQDRRWQRRRRVLDSLLVMLFVFRLVFAPRRQGYTTTLHQLWAQCRALDVPLPQPRPVSDAAICKARPKLDEDAFKLFHAAILQRAEQPGPLWHGHRLFAVDGCKLNLPTQLAAEGYARPGPKTHYPQGLLSCLYRLQLRLPVDFELSAQTNERAAALAHLQALQAPDLLVYDRGYYCFELLWAHAQRGLPAVFRLQRNICPAIDAFFADRQADQLVHILPGRDTLRELSKRWPQASFQPLPLRLVKYTHGSTEYVLGCTLLDRRRYPLPDLADLYHARWGVEELYKVSKLFLEIEQFHGHSERLVKQELFAHFNLIAMTRLFTNRDDRLEQAAQPADGKPARQANFKHSLAALAQNLEGLLLRHSAFLGETLERISEWVGAGRSRPRPDRSYPRRSRRPVSKWQRRRATAS